MSLADGSGRIRLVTILALMTGLLFASAAGPPNGPVSTGQAFADWPYGPSHKRCGKFRARGYSIFVFKARTSCRKATRILREYWLGPKRRKVIVNGGSGAFGYVLLKRYRGWKCTSGSGGGGCRKGRREAAYQVRVPGGRL